MENTDANTTQSSVKKRKEGCHVLLTHKTPSHFLKGQHYWTSDPVSQVTLLQFQGSLCLWSLYTTFQGIQVSLKLLHVMRTWTLRVFSWFLLHGHLCECRYINITLEPRKQQRQSKSIDQQSASLWKCSILLQQKFYKENGLHSLYTSNLLGIIQESCHCKVKCLTAFCYTATSSSHC